MKKIFLILLINMSFIFAQNSDPTQLKCLLNLQNQ